MPPLKKPAKSKPSAPKKPTSKSKTGNTACSQAASNWQLSIRGKEALNPDTYATLAKCRAMTSTKKKAMLNEASGKLSAQGRQAIEGRLQSRFDRGLVTQKSRTEKLKELLATRKAKQAAAAVKPVEQQANFNPDRIDRFAKSDRFLNNPALIKDFVDKKGNLKRDKLIKSRKETADFWRDARKQKEVLKAEEAKNRQIEEQAKINREKRLESVKGYKAKQERNVSIVKDFIVNRGGHALVASHTKPVMFSKPQHASQILGTDEYGNIQLRLGNRVDTIPGPELNAIFVKPARKDLAQRKWAERKARQQTPPAQPPAFSRQGQLAPGRGTQERKRLAAIIIKARKDRKVNAETKELRSKAASMLINLRASGHRQAASEIRDDVVLLRHKKEGSLRKRGTLTFNPREQARRIIDSARIIRGRYEKMYVDAQHAAKSMMTPTGRFSAANANKDHDASIYIRRNDGNALKGAKEYIDGERKWAQVALSRIRAIKQVGGEESYFVVKPKWFRGKKNYLSQFRTIASK